ncbi:LuxR C-terminal-related transcriptional regulator [Actinomadura rubrisoli]|uniref:LuxR family transcriptional regulator n=1 Tax=Actinomadura rubrisoli TaxID=2530368 RepID=A0A4R5C0K0_9ACTN|nr:LuxR C-terminal-related transcriptional regulator [Actinomadura rubrisoli]TDD92225.1 LuxR family transcriptional regulator [Actinomadura rubrisoli]
MTGSTGRAALLPSELTSFVGRRDELTRTRELVAASRLVTLIGAGGVGKTRLAFKAAAQVQRTFKDGVRVVELGELREPKLLAQTLLDALEVAEMSGRAPLTVLIDHLRRRHMLLVLDSCEHLLDEAASVVFRTLQHAPHIRILATSRHALGVPGERLMQVPPLPVPDVEAPVAPGDEHLYPALALFGERAADAVPGFTMTAANLPEVARICQQLEGNPLAIELAAVRLRVLTVAELAARLDHRLDLLTGGSRTTPARHQTLRATIGWSFQLCSPAEKLLWTRSAAFVGSFDLQGAMAVCVDERLPSESILDVIAGLIDKSILIRQESGGHLRFRLLETLREYGQERLTETEDGPGIRRRHCGWYLHLINKATAEWFGPKQQEWFVRLQQEQPNLRAAFEYCLKEPGQQRAGLRLAGSPWFLWVASNLAEGRFWLDLLLASGTEAGPERAWALGTHAYVAGLQGDHATATASARACIAMADDLDEPLTHAYGVHTLGLTEHFNGDSERATATMSNALALYEQLQAPAGLRAILNVSLGLAYLFRDHIDEAGEHFELCRSLCERHDEFLMRSYALYGFAFVDLTRGHLSSSAARVQDSLQLQRSFHDALGRAMAFELLAWIAAGRSNSDRAAVLLGCATHLWQGIGLPLFGSRPWQAHRSRCEHEARADIGDEAFDSAVSRGAALAPDEALAYALEEKRIQARSPKRADGTLTLRELQIAGLVAAGMSNKKIAEQLVIAKRTVDTHVGNILVKLGFNSRAQIASWITERNPGH